LHEVHELDINIVAVEVIQGQAHDDVFVEEEAVFVKNKFGIHEILSRCDSNSSSEVFLRLEDHFTIGTSDFHEKTRSDILEVVLNVEVNPGVHRILIFIIQLSEVSVLPPSLSGTEIGIVLSLSGRSCDSERHFSTLSILVKLDFQPVLVLSDSVVVTTVISIDSNLVAIRIPVFLVQVNNSRSLDTGVKVVIGGESSSVSVESHALTFTLESLNIGSSQSLNLVILGSTIRVEETFLGTTSSGEVTESLVHPVSPRSELSIKGISSTVDLSSTSLGVKASTKFRE